MSWLFSRALVEAYSVDICSDGEPCAPLNVMPTPQPFWRNDKTMDVLSRSPFGLTWKPLTADRGEAVLTWFLGAFPVRTSALPARVKASPESGPVSGDTLPASLARWDRDSRGWKTHQRSLAGDWEPYSETWPRWGMMRAGECYPQPMPSGLVEHRAWITSASASGSLERVPTPKRSDAKQEGFAAGMRRDSINLGVYVRIPTPTVQDAKNSTLPVSQRDRGSIPGFLISEGQASGGQLNPEWVEWLMGWPIGWTDCAPSGTDRFRKWCASHGRF